MPISGLVVRMHPDHHDSVALARRLRALPHMEVGDISQHCLAAVVDAPDYQTHDASLRCLQALPEVCAVDIVFHDFSDVSQFERLPRQPRG